MGSPSPARFGFDEFLIAASFIVLISVALAMSVQSDTWWQLRTGQIIVSTGHVPVTDSFSWTVAGGDWPNHEWIAEVLLYLAYALGGMRMAVGLCAAAIVGAWMLIDRQMAGSGRVRAYAVLAGLATQAVVWSVRPVVFSLLFIAVVLALLPHRRRHWWYPAIFLIWANTHGGVAFGGVILLTATVVSWWTDRESFSRWIGILGLSALATGITPLGFGLWRLIWHSLSNPVLALTEEWLPPSVHTTSSYPFLGLLAALLWVVWQHRRDRKSPTDWTLVASALVFAALGLKSLRHTATFALIAPMLISQHFAHVPATPAFSRGRRLVHLVALAALTIAAGAFVHARWTGRTDRAAVGADVVSALRSCRAPLFNTYEAGGPVIWAVPDRPVFVDNRQDPYPPALILQAKYVEATGDYVSLFAARGIRCALMPPEGPLPAALARAGWRAAATDGDFTVMVPPR